MGWSTEFIYFRPSRDMDYWSLSCGIGTRARERNSSSCISYKCRIFHPESRLGRTWRQRVKMTFNLKLQCGGSRSTRDRVTLHRTPRKPLGGCSFISFKKNADYFGAFLIRITHWDYLDFRIFLSGLGNLP